MASLTAAEFGETIRHFERESIHLEMRDSYGTEVEIPHMAKWAAGEPDDLSWLAEWCEDVKAFVAGGKSIRRVSIVSEPLSDYQRWSYSIRWPMVDAGEDIRWLSRRRASSIPLPGNDFFMLDRRLVIFLHYAGSGMNVDFVTSTDPYDIELCGKAFDMIWPAATRHYEYKPR